jgi:hypothetical protein
VADTISSRFVPSKLCAHRLGSFMHIDRRRVTKISWNAFVSRRSLSKSSRDYDSSSTTYSRKRMTGVGFSACSTRYASIRLSNSLCQYALPNLYISHFAISIPHMRSRHLKCILPERTALCGEIHCASIMCYILLYNQFISFCRSDAITIQGRSISIYSCRIALFRSIWR